MRKFSLRFFSTCITLLFLGITMNACKTGKEEVIMPKKPAIKKTIDPEPSIKDNHLLSDDEKKRKSNTIQMVHHVVWIMALLNNQSIDTRDLEFLYNQLLPQTVSFDALNRETLHYVQDMIKEINESRIEKREREILKEIFEEEKRKAFFACLPNNMSVIIDANLGQLIANVAQTVFYSWMNYNNIKRSLELQYKKDTWALDKDRLRRITEKHVNDFNNLYSIFKNHCILDREIVKDATRLYKIIADTDFGSSPNIEKRFRAWRDLTNENLEKEYQNFALYWFYRGIFAYYYSNENYDDENQSYKLRKLIFHKDSDLNDADYCFRKYQELTKTPVLTKDPTVAEVAARRIQIAMNSDTPDKELLKSQLKLIREHTESDSNYERYLFCGLVYYYFLKDYFEAYKMFKCAESILERNYNDKFENFLKVLALDENYDIEKDDGIPHRYIVESVETVVGKNLDDTVIKEKKETKVYLPSCDLLFFTKMSKYHSLIKAGRDQKLINEIDKTVSAVDSPLAILFYAANVKQIKYKKIYYNQILPKIFGMPSNNSSAQMNLDEPIGVSALPYPVKHLCYWPKYGSTDRFYATIPLQFATLQSVKYSMEIHREDGSIIPMPRVMEKDELETVQDSSLDTIYQHFYKDNKLIPEKAVPDIKLPLNASQDECIERIFGPEDGKLIQWPKHYNALTRLGYPTIKLWLAFEYEEDLIPKDAKSIVFKVTHKLFEYTVTYDISSCKEEDREDLYKDIAGEVNFRINKKNLEKMIEK